MQNSEDFKLRKEERNKEPCEIYSFTVIDCPDTGTMKAEKELLKLKDIIVRKFHLVSEYLHNNKILRVSEERERNKIMTTVSPEWTKGMVK